MKIGLLLLSFIFSTFFVFAESTLYYGGYIYFEPINPVACFGAVSYEIEVRLYTDSDSLPPQNIFVSTGDGPEYMVSKTDSILLQNNTTLSIYGFTHNYPGCGTYIIQYIDSVNQRHGINVQNNLSFSIQSQCVISPFFILGNSALFYDYPLVKAIKNQSFHYNPLLFDSNYDSLRFELYSDANLTLPTGVEINPQSGEITWQNPNVTGFYEFTIWVHKYKTIEDYWVFKNITIYVDSFESLPEFSYLQNWQTNADGYYEYHLEPGQNLQLFFSFKDSLADSISVENFGNVFSMSNPATFNNLVSQNEIYSFLDWTPDINAIRNFPYLANFVCRSKIDTVDIYNYLTVLIYVKDNLGIMELTDSDFSTFPNPNNGNFNLTFKDDYNFVNIKIYDGLGRLVFTEKQKNILEGNTLPLQIPQKIPGLYLLSVETEKGVFSSRLLVD